MSNSERSLRAPEGEDSGLESESVEQTVNEDEEEKGVGRRVMIRVVSRQKFEPRDLLQSQSVSWGFRLGGNYGCLCCQADECGRDLSDAKQYHRRHKVCERHANAAVVLVKSRRQRFCQQCSKFHELSEFDGTKRSCRDRLACHNKRRRKIPFPADHQAEHVPVQDAKLSRLMVTRHSK